MIMHSLLDRLKFGMYGLIFLILFGVNTVQADTRLNQKEARLIVEQSPEVQALYDLNDGKFVNCLEISVLRPCESDWVTCIDDAWVVRFHFGETCDIKHDGRLDLLMVVDAKDGHVISKFPEAPYYQDSYYCINDTDCLEPAAMNKPFCHNFIYSQINEGYLDSSANCQCQNNQCKHLINPN